MTRIVPSISAPDIINQDEVISIYLWDSIMKWNRLTQDASNPPPEHSFGPFYFFIDSALRKYVFVDLLCYPVTASKDEKKSSIANIYNILYIFTKISF